MNGRLALFTEPPRLARRHDPQTSHKAAEKAEAFRAKHEATIYAAICDAGSHGATYREIAAATGMEPVAVGRRLSAMGKRGLIYRNPNTDASGMEARDGCAVWRKA